jgi:hypothetical protein
MSTSAPGYGVLAPARPETTIVSVSGTPACTVPSLGSLRMSERIRRSSTKYGSGGA